MNRSKKNKDKKTSKLLIGSLFLFFAGGILYLLNYFGFINFLCLAQLLPADTAVLVELKVDKDVQKNLNTLFEETDFNDLFTNTIGEKFSIDLETDLQPWLGKSLGFIVLEDGSMVWAAEFTQKEGVYNFLNNFTVDEEKFVITKLEEGEIWTPAFSSNFTAGFYNKWVFFSANRNSVESILLSDKKLSENENFVKINKDAPSNTFLTSYFDSQKVVDIFFSDEKYAVKKPVFNAMAKTMFASGVFVEVKDDSIALRSKILTDEGVYSGIEFKNDANFIMPELTNLAPKNILFFMNGSDLYAKYQHTKNFLGEFDSQFVIIFDGVLRAWSKNSFGDKFDFEKDFLSKMRGQYAILADFEDAAMPFLNFTFITGFGGADIEENLSDLHDAIHLAQSQFTTKIEIIELPDGTTREEIVAVDVDEIPIQKVEFEGQTYFTVEKTTVSGAKANKKLSYGFLQNFLVFSTHEESLKSVITAQKDINNSLATNEDFRNSIMYKFSPSESYGFVNAAKLKKAFDFISEAEIEGEDTLSFGNFWKKNVRNITFSRKVFANEIFLSAVVFPR